MKLKGFISITDADCLKVKTNRRHLSRQFWHNHSDFLGCYIFSAYDWRKNNSYYLSIQSQRPSSEHTSKWHPRDTPKLIVYMSVMSFLAPHLTQKLLWCTVMKRFNCFYFTLKSKKGTLWRHETSLCGSLATFPFIQNLFGILWLIILLGFRYYVFWFTIELKIINKRVITVFIHQKDVAPLY